MPAMSKPARAFCRGFTGRVVLPWVLGDTRLRGQVLEVGGGR